MTEKRFMVVTQQIVGSPENWSTDYSSDLDLFADRQKAIDHGWEIHGHDDFSIATVDADGRLIAFGWEHEDFADPEDWDKAEIERQLVLPDSVKGTAS